MQGKEIKRGATQQDKVIEGVITSVDAIKTTLGPSGKCVAIQSALGTDITRDGATVAKCIVLQDPVQNIGAELVKKAAQRTEVLAGDGTSTTSLLIKEMCLRGKKSLSIGANVNEIKSGMLKAEKWIKDYIHSNAIKVDGDLDKIRMVASISANNDPEVGDLVVKCMEQVGIDGVITADLSSTLDTNINVTTGMKLERGWASPQYVTSPAEGTCVMNDPYIVIVGERLSSVSQIIPVIEGMQSKPRPILFVCDEIDEVVNSTLVINTVQGAIRCCVVKGIDFGDGRKNIMQDLATAVGGAYFSPETGKSLSEATIEDFGTASKVVVTRDNTVIYEGAGNKEEIAERVSILKALISREDTSDYDKTKISKRIASLSGGIGIIKAGGASEAEKLNRKATIEDSILAAKSAISEGCVPGSGYTYFQASIQVAKDKAFWKSLEGDEEYGAKIVFQSIPCIMRTIAENAGVSGDVVLNTVKKLAKGQGFNAKTKKYGNLLNEGILDSAKVIRVALENSISAASMILLIDCTIVDIDKESTPSLLQ